MSRPSSEPSQALDEVDRQILVLLGENSRRTMEDIASRVSLAASSVTRRISRLERLGVIAGYTIVPGAALAGSWTAFTELVLSPGLELDDLTAWAAGEDAVTAVHRITGEAEALVVWSLDDPRQLAALLERLRHQLGVGPRRTTVALESWQPEPASDRLSSGR